MVNSPIHLYDYTRDTSLSNNHWLPPKPRALWPAHARSVGRGPRPAILFGAHRALRQLAVVFSTFDWISHSPSPWPPKDLFRGPAPTRPHRSGLQDEA